MTMMATSSPHLLHAQYAAVESAHGQSPTLQQTADTRPEQIPHAMPQAVRCRQDAGRQRLDLVAGHVPAK